MKTSITTLECDKCEYFEIVPDPKLPKRKLDKERVARGWGISGYNEYACPPCNLINSKFNSYLPYA